MKYFTPELYARGNAAEDTVVQGVEADWERALKRYERRWRRIESAFPPGVRRFEAARICLHDAKVLHMAREENRFVIVLETEPPARNLAILTFTLTRDPAIQTEALPAELHTQRTCWLYEEFDLDRHKQCTFEVLLSNGWTVKLSFRDFHYLIAEQVFPAVNGRLTGKQAAVPRSA